MKKNMFILTICLSLIVGCSIEGCSRKKIITSGYVDLGLPSGTEWKAENETDVMDPIDRILWYDDALRDYGYNLPTKEQFEELKNHCEWEWDDSKKGYIITGNNNKSIFLPTVAWSDDLFNYNEAGWGGMYWSSTSHDSTENAWAFMFDPHGASLDYCSKQCLLAVRLVRNIK